MSLYGPALNGITGGSWLNAMLYMLEITQLVYYFRYLRKRDGLPLKSLIILCFLIDTVCTIAICAWVFLSDVIHWGDTAYLTKQYWPTPTYVFCTALVGVLVQSFLISRYYILSGQRLISLALGLLTFTAFAGGMSVAVILIFFSTYADRSKAIVTTTIWLVSSSVADISIALALVIALAIASARTSIRNTKAIISRLILVAIQSGTCTTVLALLVLSIYLAKPETNDSAYFSFCLGRAYTITMLFNLNLRKNLERGGDVNTIGGVTSTGVIPGLSGYSGTGSKVLGRDGHPGRNGQAVGMGMGSPPDEEVYHLGGIHVHRIARVTVDKEPTDTYNDSGYGDNKVYEARTTGGPEAI